MSTFVFWALVLVSNLPLWPSESDFFFFYRRNFQTASGVFRERRPTGRFSSSLFSSLVKSFLASGTEENGRHIAVRGDLTAQIYTGEFFQPHLCVDLTRVARS